MQTHWKGIHKCWGIRHQTEDEREEEKRQRKIISRGAAEALFQPRPIFSLLSFRAHFTSPPQHGTRKASRLSSFFFVQPLHNFNLISNYHCWFSLFRAWMIFLLCRVKTEKLKKAKAIWEKPTQWRLLRLFDFSYGDFCSVGCNTKKSNGKLLFQLEVRFKRHFSFLNACTAITFKLNSIISHCCTNYSKEMKNEQKNTEIKVVVMHKR